MTQRTTGVQRVAYNLLVALDARCYADSHAGKALLLLPLSAPTPVLRHIQIMRVGPDLPSRLWEQFLLPWAARSGLLLNLSGSAPMLARRQVCVIHDAAVYDRPQAYSLAFRLWYRALFWLLARRRTTLLTVSEFSRQRLAPRLGVAASRLGIVPNGGEHLQQVAANSAVLTRLGLAPGRYFLAVGSANLNKNLGNLRAAFAKLRGGQGLRLVIVGGSDPAVFVAAPGRAAEGQDGVICAGPQDDASLKALYQHAAALVFPSVYEGFGLPPLEAMSCGCPVLASNAAAIPEVCGDAALYFDPASVEQIAAAMQSLLDDPVLRKRLCQAGAMRLQQYTWDRAAQALQAHLQAACSAVGAAP